MAYATTTTGKSAKGAGSEPSGKGGGGTYAPKSTSLGAKSEPASTLRGSGISTKGNGKKLGR